MVTKRVAIAVLAMVTAMLSCPAVFAVNEPTPPVPGGEFEGQWFELTPESTARIMERLEQTNPARAAELKELRAKDAERFETELRNTIREQFRRRAIGGEMDWPELERQARGRGVPPEGPAREQIRGERPGRDYFAERQKEYFEWLKQNYPDQAEKLAALETKDPNLYQRQMELSWRKYRRIAEAARENPKLAENLKKNLELSEKRDQLVRKIRETKDEQEKQPLIEKLKVVLNTKFDLTLERKQLEYEQLLARLEKLMAEAKADQAKLGEWQQRKDEEVKARMEQLLDSKQKFDW